MLPNIGRWIAGGAAAITIGAVTRVSAPAGFWGDAPRAWVADLIDRRDLTTAQPIAAGLVAAAVACVLIAALCIWRAPTRLRPLGLAAACLPLLVLSALAGVLPAVLAIAVLAPATWAAGRLALARLALPGTTMLERILLEAGIGLGLVAFAAFAVGLVGWLNLVTVLCFVVLVGGLNAATLVGRPRNTRVRLAWRLDLGSAVLLASLLVLLQAVVPFVAAPEIMYDAVYYHLTIVHEFVSRGAVVQLPNIFASTFPLVPHLSYSAAALIGGLDAAKYVHLSVGLAGTASVYAVARRVTQDRRGGLLAALLWAATPLVLWESSTAYVDLFSSFFTALGLLCAVLWLDHRRREYAILCGIFAGLGLGVKPNMALVSAPMYVAVFALAVRNRRDIWLWIGSGVVAALVGMPWYLRAFLLTGNPVFPFLNAIFRSDQWRLVNESFNFDLFGMGKTPADIALLPWRLTFQSSRFSEVPNGALGTLPLVLAIAPVALLLTRNIRVRFIAVFLLAALMAWSAYAQYARYFLAALPGAAILAGWLFSRLVSIRPSLIGIAAYPIALGLAVSGLPIFLASFWNVPGSIPWAVDLGAETRQAYLERALRQYGAYEWMRDNLPAGEASKILGVGFGEWPIAYSPVPVYIGHMTNTGYHILIADDVETALARVREAGFRYLMIDYFPRPTSWRTSYPLTRDHVIETRLRLLYANNYIYLYALDPADASTPAPQPVINDPRFGSVGSGQQGDWHQFGAAAPTANAPCAGVSVTRGGGYLQTFDARPNTLYQFSVDMQSRSAQPGSGMIEMAWTRAKNPGGSLSIEVEPLSTNLQTFDVASTSPDDATQGTLYVTSLDDQSVCVERASGVAR